MPARRSLALLLSALAFLPAACGGDDEPNTVDDPGQQSPENAGEPAEDTGSGGAPAQGTVEIVMKNFKFEPSSAQVKIGQEISWRNEDDAKHNAFSEENSLKTEDIGKGQTAEFTPEKAGTINYICSIHPRMKATLEVADQ